MQLFIDSHAHFYPCYNLVLFLQAGIHNVNALAEQHGSTSGTPRILCLTESAGHVYFARWRQALQHGDALGGVDAEVVSGPGPEMIEVRAENERLWLLPGRQIKADNALEVSAFGLRETVPDGGDLQSIIGTVLSLGAVPVLPWGVGKWFGERGREVRQAMDFYGEDLGLSDNANRPGFWPTPILLRQAAAAGTLFGGSDPLPLAAAQTDVGRYGTLVSTKKLPENGQQVLALLRSHTKAGSRRRVGSREGAFSFIIKQASMWIRNRKAHRVGQTGF